jgi:hypothetical protein
VASLRKHPKLLPQPKKAWFTADRTLLAGVVALIGFGALQTSAVTVATNDKAPAAPVMTASSAIADYTPIGTIENALDSTGAAAKKEKEKDGKALTAPFGLRNR